MAISDIPLTRQKAGCKVHKVFLSIGSNKGVRMEYIQKAMQYLSDHQQRIVSRSDWYMTTPWGLQNQDWFINIAIELESTLDVSDLLLLCQETETYVGRTFVEKWGPREIDIDILYFDREIIELENLSIPHPYLYDRRFVLEPLNQIASDWVDPVKEMTVSELLSRCNDPGEVKIVKTTFGLI